MVENDELISAVLDLSNLYILVLSTNNRVVCFNKLFSNLYGWSEEHCKNKNIKTLQAIDYPLPFDLDDIEDLKKTNIPMIISKKINEQSSNISWRCTRLPSKHRYIFSGKNVLKTTNEDGIFHQLKKIAEGIPGNFYWKNIQAQYLGCNKTLLKTLKLNSVADIVGKTDADLWPEQAIELKKNDEAVIQQRKPAYFEETVSLSNQSQMHFTVIKMPIIDDSGTVIGILGNSLDITELKQIQKDLRKAKHKAESADIAKAEFIANMSHDIRTPLTGIIGLSHMVEDESHEESIKQYAHLLNISSEQLLSLLNSVLELVSSDSIGQQRLRLSIFNLEELLDNIIELELPSLELKSIKLTLERDTRLPEFIESDKEKMYRIILNILSNAIKFTRNGTITIKVELLERVKNDLLVKFQVIDTGIGMPKEDIQKVFDQFYRASPAHEGKFDGYGVGLHIVQKYLALLSGEVLVESEQGKGTCISFTIPLKSKQKPPGYVPLVKQESPKKTAHSIRRVLESKTHAITAPIAHVLLVEDDPTARLVVANYLKKAHCSFLEAENGAEAYQLFINHEFDFVLTDIGLPDCSGLDLSKKMFLYETAQKKNKKTPIIALSGHSTEQCKAYQFKYGLSDMYKKPLKANELAFLIDNYGKASIQKENTGNTRHSPQAQTVSNLNTDGAPLMDISLAIQQLGTIHSLYEMAELMLSNGFDKTLPLVEKYFLDRDWSNFKKMVHKFKSGCFYAATTPLLHLSEKLESLADEAELQAIAPVYEEFQQCAKKTKHFMQQWLRQKESHQ